MKHLPLERIKEIELDVARLGALNETQRQLQSVLDYWGPDGALWVGGIDGDNLKCECVATCWNRVNGSDISADENDRVFWLLDRAAKEQGYWSFVCCSDSGFPNARKMVLRAIELAA